MSIIKLTSKQDYLESVKQWKDEYKVLSEQLRELRRILSEPHQSSIWDIASHQREQIILRAHATARLEERREGKQKSWALRNARLAELNEMK